MRHDEAPQSVGSIHLLPESVVNKIAAGEVIERPASIVKELVENAVDAGARRIDIAVEEGGSRLIRVVDDGRGMTDEDVRLAFTPHATSKLSNADDLFNISTMGFRGEALASIASVSQTRLTSRPRGALSGYEVAAGGEGGGAPRETGAPEGTTVEVRNLFYNTPVRRKFLKATSTELRHITEAVVRLALPRPEIAFRLVHGKRTVLRLPAGDRRARLRSVFGGETTEQLLEVDEQTPAIAVTGFVGPPSLAQRSTQMQYVFLNGRHIRDRMINRAVMEAYRGRMVSRTFPVVVLHLRMDPKRVDVNVHPTKIEVRFRDPGAVYAVALAAVERALARAPKTEGVVPEEPSESRRKETVEQALRDYFASPRSEQTTRLIRPAPRDRGAAPEARAPEAGADPRPPAPAPGARNVTQIGNAYIVEETGEGFSLIDQHALHERILYAELERRSRDSAVSRQRLLVPDVVELKSSDFLLAMELRDALKKVGTEIEEFGDNTVAVHTVPHMMRDANAGQMLVETLEEMRADTEGEGSVTREEKLLRSMACKGAVKAGKPLSQEEIESLLDQRDRIEAPPTCPHGRPHTIAFTLSELERQFRRR